MMNPNCDEEIYIGVATIVLYLGMYVMSVNFPWMKEAFESRFGSQRESFCCLLVCVLLAQRLFTQWFPRRAENIWRKLLIVG